MKITFLNIKLQSFIFGSYIWPPTNEKINFLNIQLQSYIVRMYIMTDLTRSTNFFFVIGKTKPHWTEDCSPSTDFCKVRL